MSSTPRHRAGLANPSNTRASSMNPKDTHASGSRGARPAAVIRRRLLAVLIACPLGVGAQQPDGLEFPQDAAFEQPTIVVTAARRAQTTDDTLAHATVIDREDIESSQARDLLELLRSRAGVDLARSGGPGQSTSLFLRGTNSNHVLVLIDGVRVASSNLGSFDFAHLPLAQVERIEIVRGPRAAWWGSDAIGGVIQIFTRNPVGTAAALRGGSLGHAEAHAAFGSAGADARFGVTAGLIDIDGISAQLPGSFGFDPDADGYRNRHLSLRGGHSAGSQQLGATILATDSDVEFDQGVSAVRTLSGGASIEGPLRNAWRHAGSVSYALDRLETPAFFTLFRSGRTAVDWQATADSPGLGEIVVGAQWLREEGESFDTFASSAAYDRSRRNVGLFATWARDFSTQRLEGAVRRDDNSQFGGRTTAQVAWGWRIGERARVYASWGQGFRAPNFSELYFPGFGGDFAGNPDLEPESSRSLETGVVFTPGSGHELRLDAWRTRIDDLVAFQGPNFSAINIRKAEIDGVEAAYEWRGQAWRTRFDATWQDPRDGTTGLDLPRRPRRKAAGEVGYDFGKGVSLAVAGEVIGDRRDPFGPLPGYALLHASIAWRLNARWSLEVRGDNLTDRDYQLAAGFGQPGRTLLATLRYVE